MLSTLALEAIGINRDILGAGRMFDVRVPRPWVAYLRSANGREFLRPRADYRDANSKGSRGVMFYFFLERDGVYEVSARTSWAKTRRYFVVKIGQDLKELDTYDEALAWLAR